MGDVTRMEHVGGDPVVDFVNTLGGLPEHPDDEYLHAYADLTAFAADAGLLTAVHARRLRRLAVAHPEPAAAALAAAKALRARLDAILRARLAGARPTAADLEALREANVAALAQARLTPEGWAWPARAAGPEDLPAPLWPLAQAATDLLRHGAPDRLARCERCRRLFLDLGRDRSRRWCSRRSCGGS